MGRGTKEVENHLSKSTHMFFRLVRGLRQWEEIINLQYDVAKSVIRLASLMFLLQMACHWNGCLLVRYQVAMKNLVTVVRTACCSDLMESISRKVGATSF